MTERRETSSSRGEKLLTHFYIEKWRTALPDVRRQPRFRGRLGDIKEGSGFPCASALFLDDWNALQEQ